MVSRPVGMAVALEICSTALVYTSLNMLGLPPLFPVIVVLHQYTRWPRLNGTLTRV